MKPIADLPTATRASAKTNAPSGKAPFFSSDGAGTFFQPWLREHASAIVQRKCAACEEEEVQRKEKNADGAKGAPDVVHEALNAGGAPLDGHTRDFMEGRFGYDFGNVKIHTGALAAKSAQAINALAYTSGNNVVFNKAQYSPETQEGKRLLAHELTHVVQQGGGGGPVSRRIQRQEMEVDLVEATYEETLDLHNRGIDLPTVGGPQSIRHQIFHEGAGQWNSQTTGRRPRRTTTKRAPGFTGDTSGTYLRRIEVQIHPAATSIATLYWANMGSSPGFVLPATLNVSPGAGNCDKDCSDPAQSQENGSHCTPLSPPDYTVQGFADRLGSDSRATFVTWYHIDRGIAFHYYNVPAYPASHGCTRMDQAQSGAEWIYDNSLAGITTVRINRNPAEGQGAMCWQRGTLITRP